MNFMSYYMPMDHVKAPRRTRVLAWGHSFGFDSVGKAKLVGKVRFDCFDKTFTCMKVNAFSNRLLNLTRAVRAHSS